MTEKQGCAYKLWNWNNPAPCRNTGRIAENGAWWCGLHAPSKVVARREAQIAATSARVEVLLEKQFREQRRLAAYEPLVSAIAAADRLIGVWQIADAQAVLRRALDDWGPADGLEKLTQEVGK